MLVLGIETSCDETAASVLRYDGQGYHILSDIVSSQNELHELYGGVVPELAAREHLKNLPLVVDGALKQANVLLADIDVVGITRGPGLKGCLLMGLGFAKALGLAHAKPVLGINHIEAHVHVARLSYPELTYPYLALVVSGGHTEIVLVTELGRYEILARTIDDAAGEAFDKSANLLGLSYPGGARLAALADSDAVDAALAKTLRLPKAMPGHDDFSFSGLKTAIALLIKKVGHQALEQDAILRATLAYVIQESIIDSLVSKLERAQKSSGVRQITVTGGVAANRRLRERVSSIRNVEVFYPQPRHCMDNGVMIAFVAAERFRSGARGDGQSDGASWSGVMSRWPIESMRSSIGGTASHSVY